VLLIWVNFVYQLPCESRRRVTVCVCRQLCWVADCC